jgi:hypothetical protein
MSVNIKQGGLGQPVNTIRCIPTNPSTITAGVACYFGDIPGIAHDAEDSNGFCTMLTDVIAEIAVKGENGSGNTTVAVGDVVYIATDGVVSKITTGVRLGVVVGAALSEAVGTNTRTGTVVSSGATTTVRVWIKR